MYFKVFPYANFSVPSHQKQLCFLFACYDSILNLEKKLKRPILKTIIPKKKLCSLIIIGESCILFLTSDSLLINNMNHYSLCMVVVQLHFQLCDCVEML